MANINKNLIDLGIFFFIVVFPRVLTSSFEALGAPVYLGRIVGLIFFSFISVSFGCLIIFKSLDKIISPYSVNKGYFQAPRSRFVLALLYRGFFTLIGIGYLWSVVLPLYMGIFSLCRHESLTQVQGTVSSEPHSLLSVLIDRGIILEEQSDISYDYFYAPFDESIEPYEKVILYTLPHTKFIVDLKKQSDPIP